MAPLRRSIKAFHKRWNTPLDNNAEFQHFKNRILAAVDEAVGECILRHPSVSTKVALIVGMRLPTQSRVEPMAGRQLAQMFATRPFDETVVYHVLDASKTERELLFSLQSLFWVLREVKCPGLALLAKLVRTAIDASPWVSVKLAERGNHITLYPSGARLLDEGAVNDVLSWLDDHRPVAMQFENALKKFLGKDRSNYRNVVDNLRLALEKLLQRILGNRKSLEKQKEALCTWLEGKGAHTQIRRLYWQLLDGFANYQNDAIKHKAKCVPREAEVEYMIYLTGTFMRFVLRLDGAAEART